MLLVGGWWLVSVSVSVRVSVNVNVGVEFVVVVVGHYVDIAFVLLLVQSIHYPTSVLVLQ